jgi:hypothetical protein
MEEKSRESPAESVLQKDEEGAPIVAAEETKHHYPFILLYGIK